MFSIFWEKIGIFKKSQKLLNIFLAVSCLFRRGWKNFFVKISTKNSNFMFFKKNRKIPFFQWFFRFLEKNFWYFQNILKTAQYFFLLVSRPLRRGWKEFPVKKSQQNSNLFVFKKFLTILFFHYFFWFLRKKSAIFIISQKIHDIFQ